MLIVDCHEILKKKKNNKLLINIENQNYGMENAINCEESSICEILNEKIYGCL